MKKEFFSLTIFGMLAWVLWYSIASLTGHEGIPFWMFLDILICPPALAILILFMKGIRDRIDCGTGVKFLLPIVLGLCLGIYAWNRSIIGMPPIEGIDERFITKWTYSSSFTMAFFVAGIPLAGTIIHWFALNERIYKGVALNNAVALLVFGFCVATILAGALAVLGILAAMTVLIGVMFFAEKIERHFFSPRAKIIKIIPPPSRASTTHARRI